ncbi:MAG: glutamine amidotransferase [Vicinamibacterales bacterium]
MFESLFEFLFKYRPLMFEQGDFTFRASWVGGLALLAVVVAAAATWRSYTQVRGNSQPLDRRVLAAVRLVALAVLAFCLLRPVLVLSSVVPQQNFLGVLIDDSRSMQIADRDETARLQFVEDQLATTDGELRSALNERFSLRFFGFSSETDRLDVVNELGYSGTRTHLGQALERAHDELSGVPLSGLVVITDGADNAEDGLGESLLPIQAAGVPVFTVGLGREEFDRDIQLGRVETPRRVLKGASLVTDLVVTHRGYRGETVTVQAEDEGRIVGSEEVVLAGDGEPQTVRLRFTAGEEGPRLFTFRVSPQPGEMVTQNNIRDSLVVVEDREEKLLYFEGEPRFEVKFLRRAVSDDENLHVSILQRTAENKFMRLDVEGPDDLVGGFPRTRAELYQYRGIILGSIEANYFTPDQLRMIADFVNHRGGGLLMLGSHRSFGQGGYAGTPVADVLPVVLDETRSDGDESFFVEVGVEPTRAGAAHAATQIADTEDASAARWRELPPITIVNPITEVKPGATTLLTSDTTNGNEELVVLAFQRYGAGKVLAFPVQDSWMWQMHADIAVDDMTHETYWRRMLRWLVDGVPDQVVVNLPQDRVQLEETVSLLAAVGDANFEELNNSSVVASVTDPNGDFTDLPMEWTAENDGEYRTSFTPTTEGFYEVHVEAMSGDEVIGEDTAYVQVSPSDTEFYDSTMRTPLLERVAEETGGRFYTPDTVASLPEDIQYVGGGVTVVEEHDLWDMPALLFLLGTLVLGEWGYRRLRGLA